MVLQQKRPVEHWHGNKSYLLVIGSCNLSQSIIYPRDAKEHARYPFYRGARDDISWWHNVFLNCFRISPPARDPEEFHFVVQNIAIIFEHLS